MPGARTVGCRPSSLWHGFLALRIFQSVCIAFAGFALRTLSRASMHICAKVLRRNAIGIWHSAPFPAPLFSLTDIWNNVMM